MIARQHLWLGSIATVERCSLFVGSTPRLLTEGMPGWINEWVEDERAVWRAGGDRSELVRRRRGGGYALPGRCRRPDHPRRHPLRWRCAVPATVSPHAARSLAPASGLAGGRRPWLLIFRYILHLLQHGFRLYDGRARSLGAFHVTTDYHGDCRAARHRGTERATVCW
jgi:hypothetical protein